MNPRITSIENLIAADPGHRNIFGLVQADQLRLAAQSLRLAQRVGIITGFYIPSAAAPETDGPPGAKAIGDALRRLDIPVDYITDRFCAPALRALGLDPLVEPDDYLSRARPTHLVSVERVGRGADGRYRNMRGEDITPTSAPLDAIFIEAARLGLTTIGIGDGGNEIGMGRVFSDALREIPHGRQVASVVPTDFCIASGVSNWGAYGLAGALSVLVGRDLMPTPDQCAADIRQLVETGAAVDGVRHEPTPTVDGLDLSHSIRMVEQIRAQVIPSPLEEQRKLLVGIIGFGETGQAAARLALRRGHQVKISDAGPVTIEKDLTVAGVESGGHTVEFLADCDLAVTSPGVSTDSPIVDQLHRRGVYVASELEFAAQLCPRPLIGVTGTIGKRSTVELIAELFARGKRPIPIGGNRGRPLSALLLDQSADASASNLDTAASNTDPIAVAVSSFQLESTVSFRPHVAIMLNIDEAHLDRHRSIAEYIRTKSRIFMNHRPDDVLILNFDDLRLRPLARKHHGVTLFVSTRQPVDRGAWLESDTVCVNLGDCIEQLGPLSGLFPTSPPAFSKPVSTSPLYPVNALCAILTARLHGLDCH